MNKYLFNNLICIVLLALERDDVLTNLLVVGQNMIIICG